MTFNLYNIREEVRCNNMLQFAVYREKSYIFSENFLV